MEVLTEERIKAFLAVDVGYSIGYGKGIGYDNGDGNGNGDGPGYGYGNGTGYGTGNGYGYSGGPGDSNGCGFGNGRSISTRYGYDIGYGRGISNINGYSVYKVDEVSTIITSIRGNIAQGFILEKNTKLVPCYIVKENNKFAHGKTLHEAFTALQEKLYDGSTEEERIEAFKKKFPQYDIKYNNADLFAYHHILTGSCRMGRESFVNSKGLSLDGKTSVREFVELTKYSYGGDIIEKLPKEYGITD